jgi:3-oxoacyl-[acyl-carrier-protein] synthase II
MKNDRIVITGISAVTPIGNDIHTIEKNLTSGYSGIKLVTRYNLDGFLVRHGAIIDESILDTITYPIKGNLQFKLFYFGLKKLLSDFPERLDRVGCFIGFDPNASCVDDVADLMKYTNMGSADKFSVSYSEELRNTLNAQFLINFNPSLLMYHGARDFGFSGPCMFNLGTCSASTQAIGDAYRMLSTGSVDKMIAGGVSTKIDPISIARLCRLEALEETKVNCTENCTPFDKRRSGFTLGEGVVLFMLERESDALKRNATIYSVISGYGTSTDCHSVTDPHPEALGMYLAMQRALEDASLSSSDIDYVNAHGTGTPKNDKFETMAIKKLLKETAYSVNISSTKSMHGHMMTAAGAMEVLVSTIAINGSFVPPTINYCQVDPDCDLNYTPNVSKTKSIRHALSNSFGMGGQNAALIISKYN